MPQKITFHFTDERHTLFSCSCFPALVAYDFVLHSRYTLSTVLVDSTNVVLDALNTSFGIRNVTFDAANGLFVNGFYTKLRGLSIHQVRPSAFIRFYPFYSVFVLFSWLRYNSCPATGTRGHKTIWSPFMLTNI